MIVYDVNELNQLLVEAVSSNSDVVALLGDGAAGVFHARHLEDKESMAKRARPLLAWREGPIIDSQRIASIYTLNWYVYDDPDQGYYRINALLPLLGKAFVAADIPNQYTTAAVSSLEIGNASNATRDAGLNLLLRYLTVAVNLTSGIALV